MIAIAGGKGGCGKTTTSLGIARVLGERESVTIVDADVDMPDLHVETNTPPEPGADGIADGRQIPACRHSPLGEPGISVVPAGSDMNACDSALRRLRQAEDRIIVDTAAGASVDVTTPLRRADRVVLVSTPTRESLVDTAKTAAIARSIGTPIAGVVLNRSDGSLDPSPLLDCAVLSHVPTVADGEPWRVARASYAAAVAGF